VGGQITNSHDDSPRSSLSPDPYDTGCRGRWGKGGGWRSKRNGGGIENWLCAGGGEEEGIRSGGSPKSAVSSGVNRRKRAKPEKKTGDKGSEGAEKKYLPRDEIREKAEKGG